MFENQTVEKDIFDNLIIDIGSDLYTLQMSIINFIVKLISKMEFDVDIDFDFPYLLKGRYNGLVSKRLFYDEDDDMILLDVHNMSPIPLSEIDISSLERLANDIHMKYVSKRNYLKLIGGNLKGELLH